MTFAIVNSQRDHGNCDDESSNYPLQFDRGLTPPVANTLLRRPMGNVKWIDGEMNDNFPFSILHYPLTNTCFEDQWYVK